MNTQYRQVTDSRLHLLPILFRRNQRSRAAPASRSRQRYDGPSNATGFERLLLWLGPDSDAAGQRYETIRARLIAMFRSRRCVFAEDLADVAFERVARRLTTPNAEFISDPIPYFYGVARNIYLEYLRELNADKLRASCWSPTTVDNSDSENMLELLDKALSMIANADRELILGYYAWNGRKKIDHRRVLANQLGIGLNALRLRVFRIRREIKQYMGQMDAELAIQYS